MKKEISHQIKRTDNVNISHYNIVINFLVYDKLSSHDVFDFDNYLNQFEGLNKEFMEKFVRTQSFNNFIEETYKNTTP